MSNVTDKCMCGLKGVTGDGCKYCTRELYIECLEDELAELRMQLDEPCAFCIHCGCIDSGNLCDSCKNCKRCTAHHPSNVRRLSEAEIVRELVFKGAQFKTRKQREAAVDWAKTIMDAMMKGGE